MEEVEFSVSPPGLVGLNRLAKELKALKKEGDIPIAWHLGRWGDPSQATHFIIFDSEEDAIAAKLALF